MTGLNHVLQEKRCWLYFLPEKPWNLPVYQKNTPIFEGPEALKTKICVVLSKEQLSVGLYHRSHRVLWSADGGNENFCERQGGAFPLLHKVMVVPSLSKTGEQGSFQAKIFPLSSGSVKKNNRVTSLRLMVTQPKNRNINLKKKKKITQFHNPPTSWGIIFWPEAHISQS